MRDILFVDDERDLLDSVRARLYKHRHDCAASAMSPGSASAVVVRDPDSTISEGRVPRCGGHRGSR